MEVRPDGHVVLYRAYIKLGKESWRADGGTYATREAAQAYVDGPLKSGYSHCINDCRFAVRSHRGMKKEAYRIV